MDTATLDLSPQKGESKKNGEKASKAKGTLGKAAKLAAASGVGAAATMAANAVNTPHEHKEEVKENPETPYEKPEQAPEETTETVAEVSTTEFDPNEIMIEDVEEVTTDKPENPSTDDSDIDPDQPEIEPIVAEPITNEDLMIEPESEYGPVVDPVDKPEDNPADDIVEIVDIDDVTTLLTEDDEQHADPIDPGEELPLVYDPSDDSSEWIAGDSGVSTESEDFGTPDVLDDILNA